MSGSYNTRGNSSHKNGGNYSGYSNHSSGYPSSQNYGNSYNNYQNQNSMMKSNLKVIQDQNFSNETFFMAMSSLESLSDYFSKQGNNFSNKMFREYDRFNYSSKSDLELKSQLSTHILLLQASKQTWQMENPSVKWKLPNNFPKEKSVDFINHAIQTFKTHGEKDCVRMCEDMLDILNDKLHGLNIDKMSFNPEYSQKEKDIHRKNLLKNGI